MHDIPCRVIQIDARPPPGESPESWAREKRYQALRSCLHTNEMLLIAQHQDDQAETVLLQLLRGSGPRGLAAMPCCVRFGDGWLARPLLDFTRAELQDYALDQGLQWIEDESNQDIRYDRNYLRQRILPSLRQRWPQLSLTLARAAIWQQEAVEIMAEVAHRDLGSMASSVAGTLSIVALLQLSPARRRNALRQWLRDGGLTTPSTLQLQQLEQDVLLATWDARPCLTWPGTEIRRYRDALYAIPPLVAHDPTRVWQWEPPARLDLGIGDLWGERVMGSGIGIDACVGKAMWIGFRRGGENCLLPGRRHAQSLKHLLQAAGIPPWQRDRLPLIYIDEQLAAVADLWTCAPFSAKSAEPGWRIHWQAARQVAGLRGGEETD